MHRLEQMSVDNFHGGEEKNWSGVPGGGLTLGQTGRLTVGRKMTLTLTACGGRLQYLHLSPASRNRRQKENTVFGGITGQPAPGRKNTGIRPCKLGGFSKLRL
jgi:hypothetical protein